MTDILKPIKMRVIDSLAGLTSLFNNESSDITNNVRSIVNGFAAGNRVRETDKVQLYIRSTLIQKAIDKIPEFAQEFSLSVTSEQELDMKPLIDAIRGFKVRYLFCQASKSARIFKESYLLLFVNDGKELNEELILDDSVEGLSGVQLLEYGDLTPRYLNASKRVVGSYDLVTADKSRLNIHPSRLLIFEGKVTTPKLKELNNGLSVSAIEGMIESYRLLVTGHWSIHHALSKLITFVFKLNGLKDLLLLPGSQESLINRVRDASRALGSHTSGFILDGESEDVDFLTPNLAGAAELVHKQRQLFTANCDLPHDILWNEGSHDTASELEHINTNKIVKAFIRDYWQENINKIIRIIATEFYPVDTELDISLEIPEALITLAEKTDSLYKQAQIDKIYSEIGTKTTEELKTEIEERTQVRTGDSTPQKMKRG